VRKIVWLLGISLISASCNRGAQISTLNPVQGNMGQGQPAVPVVKTYTSEKLGVSFKYLDKDPLEQGRRTEILENPDKTYIYIEGESPKTGQSVQTFKKNSDESLQQAVRTQLLQAYPNCKIKIVDYDPLNTISLPNGYQGLQIYPEKWDSLPANAGVDVLSMYDYQCPGYFGAARYFLYDTKTPTNFAFLDIGQYSIAGSSTQNAWQDTIKFIK